jgi:transcription elongation factor Elf1
MYSTDMCDDCEEHLDQCDCHELDQPISSYSLITDNVHSIARAKEWTKSRFPNGQGFDWEIL